MSDKSKIKKLNQEQARKIKSQARDRLDSLQRYMGIMFFLSAALGIYLLSTDNSLWLLASSHAYGLIAICAIDVGLGIASLIPTRKVLLPSVGWGVLTILLQLGDIVTAPQYKMTMAYFASYLFSLWAFDAILLVQAGIVAFGLSTRKYQKVLVKRKQQNYFEMGLKSSRRDFLQIAGTIGAFVVLAVGLSAWSSLSSRPGSSSGNTTQTSNLPSGAVGNVNQLQVGVPVYFDYPSAGYTNLLLKKASGSVIALSALCTHVCCQCQFDSSAQEIACPCHGSLFDLNGKVLRGPASTPLPSIQLSIDSSGVSGS